MTYADIVRKIRSTVDPKKSHVQEAIGEAGSVRALTSKVQLEIMDLDCVATPDDVTDTLRRETGRDVDFRVYIFGPNHAEQYMAVCELDSREADALLRRGRIEIAWVHCRVRERLTVTKCYRCLGFGLVKADCKDVDRTKCCRKCGISGHHATDCKNKPVCPLCSEVGHKEVAHLAGTGRTADMLLPQIADERDADILILCEPYRRRMTQAYITNATETTAIWVRGATQLRVFDRGVGDDFVWARVGAVTCVSVYLTPNCTAAEFERKVALLEDGIRDLPGDVIVAGDLNARAIEWGMTETNRIGRLLLEMAARLDLVVVNTGNTPTYRRPGFGDSIPDVTMTSDRILPQLKRWQMVEDYTASDHQYIVFEVAGRTVTRRTRPHRPPRWNLDKLDGRKFSEVLMAVSAPVTKIPPELTGRQRVERLTDETAKLIDGLCNSTIPKQRQIHKRRPQYWWTDEIAALRTICLANRRRVTRAGGGPERETSSKTRCWRKLCEKVNADPWGTGYKIVTGKLGARVPPELKDVETARRIVDGLSPKHLIRTNVTDDTDVPAPSVFTAEELTRAMNTMKTGKAPGPDGVPAWTIDDRSRTATRNTEDETEFSY
ncbi:uncharacterized protein [Venturia canescens]|uniref:uncharacterized protein n=1 Tax=Venturia canescens TaxID=32260 RepID=UPI001C9D5211|nr:uncharacterized protein LOC122408050 [Venturia canescens]